MKRYLVLLCFYYLPLSAQDHKTLNEKTSTEDVKVEKSKGKSTDNEMMKEEEKTVQDLNKEQRSEANTPKPIKRGRTKKTVIKVQK